MTKSSKNWWGRFLFQDRGILPTTRLVLVYAGVLLVFILIGMFSRLSWGYIVSMNAVIFLASLLDLFFSPRRSDVTVRRKMPEEMERDRTYKVEVEIQNPSDRPFSYSIVDGLPQSFQRPFPLKGSVGSQSAAIASYDTAASSRGDYVMKKLYFRYRSTLGLWEKQITFEMEQKVKVIPDLSETRQYLQDAQKFLLHEGTRVRKYSSGSGEFAQIRKYAAGDDPRMINWRQTAKLQEVMTNEYEPEHGKYITILIDCGRMMGAELSKGNRLERVLESAITVSAAALRKGDYVSVLAFSKEVKVFVPPAKGMEHLQTILHSIYGLQVDPVESNYAAVFSYLETMQKKRSLLLLFSDIRTFLYEENALAYLIRLRQRHLFLMIGIEDRAVLDQVKEEPVDVHSAMVKSIAQKQILFQKREKRKWETRGLLMTEAREENLAVAAVSFYMDLMNRNLL